MATVILDQLPGLVQSIIDTLLSCAPKLHEGALKLLMGIVTAIERLLPILIKSIPDIVMCIVGLLTAPGTVSTLIDGALTLLLAIVDAIPLLIDQLVPLIPSIVIAIIGALLDATPQLIKAGFTLLSAIGKAIPQACAAILKNLPQIASTIFGFLNQLPSRAANIGVELVRGLWQGISNRATWLKNQIKSWVGNVTSFLKRLFGINSPSKVTAYMGEMLDEGLAVGIEDNAGAPKSAMSDLTNDLVHEAGLIDGVAIERQLQHNYNVSTAAASSNAGLLGKLDKILAAIERGQILTIDSNALVGATANTMNNALGQRRVLAGRGAV